MNRSLLAISALSLSGCGDDALVTIYQKSITQKPIKCLKLNIFPEDKTIEDTLINRYRFNDNCELALDVSHKSGIKCNSRFNIAVKSTSKFPNSYLKMEIRSGFSLAYSYYVDLTAKPSIGDVNRGWDRLSEDLNIKNR